MTTPDSSTLPALVQCMRHEAHDILSLELVRLDGGSWPDAGPGAHVDLAIPGVGLRQYSLLPSPDPQVLWVGIQRDPRSRGGSRWVHEALRPGQTVGVGAPRNHFALVDGTAPVCLIAGGIGITPLLSMATALARGGRPWRLHYGVRSRDRLAFARLLHQWPDQVVLHVDDEAGGPPGLAGIVAAAAPGTHFYACGPAPMLQSFAEATADQDPERVHVEHFAAPEAPAADAATGGFVVELARSGRSLPVPADQSLLDALLAAGVDVPHSCRNGVCGSCETRVLDGTPDHRDMVLSPQERASGKTLMVCCSRARSERLVLDL